MSLSITGASSYTGRLYIFIRRVCCLGSKSFSVILSACERSSACLSVSLFPSVRSYGSLSRKFSTVDIVSASCEGLHSSMLFRGWRYCLDGQIDRHRHTRTNKQTDMQTDYKQADWRTD